MRVAPEPPRRLDQPPRVRADPQRRDVALGERVHQPADRLGRLGRVLGDVTRELARRAPLERPDLGLRAPPDLTRGRAIVVGLGRGGVHRRMPDRSERCVDQQLAAVTVRRLDGAILRHAIEPQDEVEVQRTAALTLRDLHVRRPHLQLALLRPGQARELARHLIRRPPPQLRRHRVPQHRVLVVEAPRADRLPQARVVFVVDLVARERRAMRARLALAPWPASARLAVDDAARVHRSEPGRGERQEDHRMPRDSLGNALAAAHPRGDELERVTATRPRAARAHCLAPVAAALQQRLVRLAHGRDHRANLAGLQIDRINPATQADRPSAVARRAQLPLEALPLIRIGSPSKHALEHRPHRHRGHDVTSSSSHSSARRDAARDAISPIASSSR